MNKVDPRGMIGIATPWRKIEYNWRDSALYALAVGADENDLLYTYEKNMKAVPSFGALPYYSAVNNEPQQPLPRPANYVAADWLDAQTGEKLSRGMHAGFEMVYHRPIEPIKGSLVYNTYVKQVYDKKDKGIMIEVENPVYDEAGRLLCTNTSYHLVRACGNFGGEDLTKGKITFPDREPDMVVESYISRTQNVLYRLTGDTNYVHVDPEIANARTKSDKGPFMQGLSSFGSACLLMCKAILPGEPERMKRIYVQMKAIAYPNTPVELRIWKVSETKALFRYIDQNTGKAILDNCEFEWN